MKSFLLPLLIVFTFNAFAQNQRFYVRQNISGANDGSSWQNAFSDLQDALAVAQPGDSVWVAEGIYYPTSTADRTISFRVKSGVSLFGGFAGNETALSERDWETHPVVLSGAIGSIFSTDNSLHIMYLENPDSNTLLDGLQFTKGVEDADTTDLGGAAIYIWAKDTLGTPVSATRIRNCRFEDNSSVDHGGAVTVSSYGTDYTRFEGCIFIQNDARYGGATGVSAVEIQTEFVDCQFVSNKAHDGGGAIAIESSVSGARFSGCHFEKNRTKDSGGAAVYHGGESLTGKGVDFSDCTFVENVCEINNYPEGGVVYMANWGGSDTLKVENCIFTKNTGFKAGGVYVSMGGTLGSNFQFGQCHFEENEGHAIRVDCSGGCSDNYISSLVVRNSEFWKNKGGTVLVEGNAIPAQQTQVQMDSCRFEEGLNGGVFTLNIEGDARLDISNSVFRKNNNGEVIVAFASEIFLINCVIEENKQSYWLFSWEDGTMDLRNCLFRENQTFDFMFAANFSTLNAINCHFDSNEAADYPFPFFDAQATIVNSVFTNNTGTPYVVPGYLNPYFRHCYFDIPIINPPSTMTFGPGILTGVDPLFENIATGNFHLQPCSPLVGAGDNAATTGLLSDITGLPRIQGGTVDIGIYERPAPGLATAPVIKAPCPGDQTGSIDFQPVGGCAPYTVAWSSGVGSGQNLDDLAAGDYIFSITDARGSVLVLPVTIPEKPLPTLAPATTPVTCGDTLGGSAVLAANGTAPFAFSWPDQSTDTVRTGLASGIYAIKITDGDGCAGIDTVMITTQGRLGASVKIDKITCPGYADGSLIVTPDNGLAPFHWQWESGDTTASIAGLGPGLYRLTLTDALGCAIVWTIPLVEPDVDCQTWVSDAFPNPFSESLTVQTAFVPDETSHWILTDAKGKIVVRVPLLNVQTRLTFPDLPPGIYFWQIWHHSALERAGRVVKMNKG